MPRPRMTLRRMMACVALVATVSWAATAAIRVRYFEPACHMDVGGCLIDTHDSPFWPRFGRRLLGKSVVGPYRCPDGAWQDDDPERDMQKRVDLERFFHTDRKPPAVLNVSASPR